MNRFWLIIIVVLAFSCGRGGERLQVNVGDEVISTSYCGNGVEWEPYDEAASWGCELSGADWQKLFTRVDFMRPGFVRCMINSTYRYYDDGKYVKERNSASLLKLLEYCQSRGIDVVYGEFNPPEWSMKGDEEWVKMSVNYLNWLVQEKGLGCIKHFIIFNEPDGDWASTNGDYAFWRSMMLRFHEEMQKYPGLLEKVSLAGPDVVIDYKNPASSYDAPGWVSRTAEDLDAIVGIYDVHAYPGQYQVRSGAFRDGLANFKVPEGKKLILGEAGYKYWRQEDSLLQAEFDRRAAAHPFTSGSDSQMLCGDFFYGLDLALLSMDVMNSGLSGMAVWMLDDAMHSCGDSGKPEDLKIWGFWNILGEEIFADSSLEDIKPAFYSWSLMCRYFPRGCNILKVDADGREGLRTAAAEMDGRHTFAAVNYSDKDYRLDVTMELESPLCYIYSEKLSPADQDGLPVPVKEGKSGSVHRLNVPAGSFVLLTDMK